jgi:hypothetical protein
VGEKIRLVDDDESDVYLDFLLRAAHRHRPLMQRFAMNATARRTTGRAARRRAGALLLLLLLLPACHGGRAANESAGEVVETAGAVDLTTAQKRFVLTAARTILDGGTIPAPDAAITGIAGGGAGVEVHLTPEKPVARIVGGPLFWNAFTKAARQAADDPRFRSAFRPRLARARIKVCILDRVFRLSAGGEYREDLREIDRRLEGGVHGLILVRGGKPFFLHPDLVVTEGLGLDPDTEAERLKRVTGRRLWRRHLATLPREVASDPAAWRAGALYAFTTSGFIDAFGRPGEPVGTFRANVPVPPVTGATLRTAAAAIVDYLVRATAADGRPAYRYYAVEDEYDAGFDLVHHAGTAWRLIQAYDALGDARALEAARRALGSLRRRTVVPQGAPGVVVEESGDSPLGANAVMAIVHASLPIALRAAGDPGSMTRFGEAVLAYRMPEAGRFYTTLTQVRERRAPERQASYFPGIALLAMVRLFERTRETKWWDAAIAISRGREAAWRTEGPDAVGDFCWEAQAWARMARLEEDAKRRAAYRRLAYSHADAVLGHQWTPERPGYFRDYLGAADNSAPPRTTPTSARAEALAETYRTAKVMGDVAAQRRYGVALLRALHFVVENQYGDENTWYLPAPAEARGGIRGGLTAGDIRIDYCQHALAAMLYSLDVPSDLKALGVEAW